MAITNETGIGHFSVSTSRRLEIFKEIEGTFPGLPTEQVLDLARWVEGDASAADEKAKEFQRKVEEDGDRMSLGFDPIHFKTPNAPRKWTNLEAIPSTVKAITDRVGDRAEPQARQGKRAWVFTDAPIHGIEVSFQDGPFTEALENE